MGIADTSFLYALFSSTDEFHERARRAVQSAEPIVIPPEIYAETLALIHYRQGFDEARDAGDGFGTKAILNSAFRLPNCTRGLREYSPAVWDG